VPTIFFFIYKTVINNWGGAGLAEHLIPYVIINRALCYGSLLVAQLFFIINITKSWRLPHEKLNTEEEGLLDEFQPHR
jgi:hypothetical protein